MGAQIKNLTALTGGVVDLTAAASVSVPAASADAHALNRTTADGRYATTAQGGKADTALQPAALATLTLDGAKAIAFAANGQTTTVTTDGNHALTLSDPADTAKAWVQTVRMKQDAVGGRVPTWVGIATPGAVAPTFSAAANAVDRFEFAWNGADWELRGAYYAIGAL